MQLRTLIIIALRLFTIYWLVQCIEAFLLYIPVLFGLASSGIAPPAYSYLVAILGMFFVAGVLWFSSFRLSGQVAKGLDIQLNFVSLTKEDLYCFAFVFLGIFFGLSSIYSTIQTGSQFFTYDFPLQVTNQGKGQYLWPFLGHAFTLVAGFACVYGAKTWTNKLIRLEKKNEVPSAA